MIDICNDDVDDDDGVGAKVMLYSGASAKLQPLA